MSVCQERGKSWPEKIILFLSIPSTGILLFLFYYFIILGHYDSEDPYPSLSDYHDYEPQLEFDDSELLEQKPEDLGDEGEWIVRTRPDLEDRDGVVYSVGTCTLYV